jgi:outer membrane protein assembly factor BamB
MTEFKRRPVWAVVARGVAGVAGLLAIALCALLLADEVRMRDQGGLDDPVLLTLRAELAERAVPSEQLVEQIRNYDWVVRQLYFTTQGRRMTGGGLLLGAAVICFLGFALGNSWSRRPPDPAQLREENPWEQLGLQRQLLLGSTLVFVVAALFLSLVTQSDLEAVMRGAPQAAAEPVVLEGQVDPVVTWSVMKQNWPALRGAGGLGVAGEQSPPLEWNMASGEGVLWSVELPLPGYNSPVVWGNRLFLSGGDEARFEVFCFDTVSGALVWSRVIDRAEALPEVTEDTGYAAATMATDGARVFAIFATGDLVALDFEGRLVWHQSLGVPENPYGMGSSLMTDGTRLFVQYDHLNAQKVMAFACDTGKMVWSTPRTHISWSTPALIETPFGKQLVLNDEAHVTAYDPADGRELWRVKCLGGEVAPSPAFDGHDMVFVANEYAEASAIRVTAKGAELLWQYDDYLPEIASPLATPDYCFILTTGGEVVCLDAKSGEPLWEQEFDEGFNASPVLVKDRVYAADISGVIHVFRAADAFELLSTIDMGEAVFGTPAFVDGKIYIRTDRRLVCVGADQE